MVAVTSFPGLSAYIKQRAVNLSRRIGDPAEMMSEAKEALSSSMNLIEVTHENIQHTPDFVHSCAMLLKGDQGLPPTMMQQVALLCDAACDQNSNFNDLALMAHSCYQLAEAAERAHRQATPLREVMESLYKKSIHRMRTPRAERHTDMTIRLLRCCDAVYHPPGRAFPFHPVGAEIHSLLPTRSKMQMEAKMQKSGEAREILTSLREMRFSRLDAGILLGAMSDLGLYDQDVTNRCCETLKEYETLLSSQQLSHIVYSLGVLQHRHMHQRTFASAFNATQDVTHDGMRKFLLGLACLQVPYPGPTKRLVDWLFLHALRHPERDPNGPDGAWYVDCSYGLACMNIVHHKFTLMSARRARKGIGQQSTHQKLKFLYALGAVKNEQVAPDLVDSWRKIPKTMHLIGELLKSNVSIEDGPLITNALLFCEMRDHPLVPKVSLHHRNMNPVQQILAAWTTEQTLSTNTTPKAHVDVGSLSHHSNEARSASTSSSYLHSQQQQHQQHRALELAEQIRPCHFRNDGAGNAKEVVEVMSALAFGLKCSAIRDVDKERFRTLCDQIELHVRSMSVEDLVLVLRSMLKIGLCGPRFSRCQTAIVDQLWDQRHGIQNPNVQVSVCDALDSLAHIERAMDMLEFIAEQRERQNPQHDSGDL